MASPDPLPNRAEEERRKRIERRRSSWDARFETKKVSELQTGQVIWIEPKHSIEAVKAMGEKLHFAADEIDSDGQYMPHIVLPLSDNDTVRRVVAKFCTRHINLNKTVEAKLSQPGKHKLWKFFIPDCGQKPIDGSGQINVNLKLEPDSKEPYARAWILSLLVDKYSLWKEENTPVSLLSRLLKTFDVAHNCKG